MNDKIKAAAKSAFPYTLPIAAGFFFLGGAYGIYAKSLGFHFLYPIITAMLIYAGSVEFVVTGLLILPFAPLHALLLTLIISARQVFYGISMLEKYQHAGKKKWFLISTLVDESFSLNYLAQPPAHIDRYWYMFWVSLFLYVYWSIGVTLGSIFGQLIPFDLTGIEFAMPAIFIVIFAHQWTKETSHKSSILGLVASISALLIFGSEQFLLPALITIWAVLTFLRPYFEQDAQEFRHDID